MMGQRVLKALLRRCKANLVQPAQAFRFKGLNQAVYGSAVQRSLPTFNSLVVQSSHDHVERIHHSTDCEAVRCQASKDEKGGGN